MIFSPGLSSYTPAQTIVSAQQAKNMIDTDERLIVVDVRDEAYVYVNEHPDPLLQTGYIPGALNYPWQTGIFQAAYDALPMDADILLVCHDGQLSRLVGSFLRARGYGHVYVISGGMSAWTWDRVAYIDTDRDGIDDDLDNRPYVFNPAQGDARGIAGEANLKGASRAPTGSGVDRGHIDVTVEEAKAMIENNPNLIVVDVREEEDEYCAKIPDPPVPPGHIDGALNLPWTSGVFEDRYDELPVDAEILLLCRAGYRSNLAAVFLDAHGYPNVYDMLWGMGAWEWETTLCVDTDEDGFNDDVDNCPDVYNPAQLDADGNGIGDACQILYEQGLTESPEKHAAPDIEPEPERRFAQ
jgi:rhodanese-related sulfurtransferase